MLANPVPALADVEAATARIDGRILRTPVLPSPSLSVKAGVPVLLKLEHHQFTGSFKLRGATNAVLSLTPEERTRGVIAVSTGNHGRALAYAAKAEGSQATICMSELVPDNKVTEIRNLGARVVITGKSQDEAQESVDRLIKDDGLMPIPPFDHRDVIAGQGTLGLEIFAQAPNVDTVLVPVSGGGLAAGIALTLKARNPAIRIIGVSMENGAAMKASLDAGEPVLVAEHKSLADSLGGGIGLDNRYTFPICADLLEGIVTVTEVEIADAIAHAFHLEGQVIEGSGAVGIAALLAGKIATTGPVVCLVTGQNIDRTLHRKLIDDPQQSVREFLG